MFRSLPLARIKHSLSTEWNLSEQDVRVRREKYGENHITEKAQYRWLAILIATLLDPMIWFLFIASFLFTILGQHSEAIIMLLAIIPIGGMDGFLHWRTQVSTRALSSRLTLHVQVIRDNQIQQIPTPDLVPGDLLLLKAGEYISADGIFIATQNIQIDESLLTGESIPIEKHPLTILLNNQSDPLIDYQHWGFVGTRLLTGHGLLRVVYTGKETLYGEIIQSVLKTHYEKTPLQNAIARFVFVILLLAIVFCFILACIRLYQGFGIIDAILSATILAVAALPDEFPMVLTFFLGVGVYRLAKEHALVRRAVSIENIGRVNYICTDKTGTITTGRLRVMHVLPADNIEQKTLLQCANLASHRDSGDPLDIAIADYAKDIDSDFIVLKTLPFTENERRETALYAYGDKFLWATKGAPEIILEVCQLKNDEVKAILTQVQELSQQAYKVIACARAITDSAYETEIIYEYLGLLAFADSLRPEVKPAIQYCQTHNIHVLMITGDHPATAKKIAHDINLGEGAPNVMLAQEIDELLKIHDPTILNHVDVIARAMPAQKLRYVKTLRKRGDIVAVTGDGVNDVPALKQADVGIAMGERGTQSAREVAAIILLDDNFGTIVNAIKEGKQLFKNLQLSFKYILLIHAPYVISATLIPLLGYPLLYYPIHIVWIELFIHPTCLLVFQDLPNTTIQNHKHQSPRSNISIFNNYDWLGISLVSLYTISFVVVTYYMSLKFTNNYAVARANAFTAVGLTHIALVIGLTRLQSKIAVIIVIGSVLMLLFLVQISDIAHYFLMQPPNLITWITLSFASIFTVLLSYYFR